MLAYVHKQQLKLNYLMCLHYSLCDVSGHERYNKMPDSILSSCKATFNNLIVEMKDPGVSKYGMPNVKQCTGESWGA